MLEIFFWDLFKKILLYLILVPLNSSDLFPAAFNVNLKGMRKCTGMKGINKKIKSDTKINAIKVYVIKELIKLNEQHL